MKKLKQRKGETIVETLIAMLIICLCVSMIAGSIVAAAKANRRAAETNIEFRVENPDSKQLAGFGVSIVHDTSVENVTDIKGYQTGHMKDGSASYEKGYYYYEYK